jgi:hypothetical protein
MAFSAERIAQLQDQYGLDSSTTEFKLYFIENGTEEQKNSLVSLDWTNLSAETYTSVSGNNNFVLVTGEHTPSSDATEVTE